MLSLICNAMTLSISTFFRLLLVIWALIGMISPALAQNTPLQNITLLTVSPTELNFTPSVRHETNLGVRIPPLSSLSGKNICLCNCSANQDPDKQPLYLADGVVITDIRSLSPIDIQAITVMTGAKAKQKYGVIGKNGVIEITMKRPRLTKTDAEQVPKNN
jgi:hypothetical protein